MKATAEPEEQNLSTVDTTESRELALRVAAVASDKKASEIRILDLGELLGITDFFVLCSASNERLLRTVADEVQFRVKQDDGRLPHRREGTAETGWIILDYGIVVVHAFTEEQRRFYGLERLWSDAPVIEVDGLVGMPVADIDRARP